MTAIEIGGAKYEAVGPDSFTVQYDLYMQDLLSGIDVSGDLPPEEQVRVLLTELAQKDRISKMLAGFMVPPGQKWSPVYAKVLAARLDGLTNPDDRRTLYTILAQGLLDFFQRGGLSSKTSQKSSGNTESLPYPSNEAVSNTADGTKLFGRSRPTTRPRWRV